MISLQEHPRKFSVSRQRNAPPRGRFRGIREPGSTLRGCPTCSARLVWGLGFGVWGLGFGVWVVGFGVWGLRFGVYGLGFRVLGVGSTARVCARAWLCPRGIQGSWFGFGSFFLDVGVRVGGVRVWG